MEQTLIDGKPVWFAVCAKNDCNAVLVGPYFSLEKAEEEANVTWCDFAHFVIPKAIEWMEIGGWYFDTTVESWAKEHNIKATKHPNYSHKMENYGCVDEDYAYANHCGSRLPNGVASEFKEALYT